MANQRDKNKRSVGAYVDKKVLNDLKELCKKRGITLTDALSEAIDLYMDDQTSRPRTRHHDKKQPSRTA